MIREQQPMELPGGLPKILDLTSSKVRRATDGFAEIIFVSRQQLEEALAEVDRVDDLARRPGRTLIQFVPYGPGFFGIPHCPSGDGRTCWPLKLGPDDNPTAFVCVCRVEGGETDPLRIPRPSCYLDFTTSPFKVRCVRGTCRRSCRLGAAVKGTGSGRMFLVGCSC